MSEKARRGRRAMHPGGLATGFEHLVEEQLDGRLRRWLRSPLQPVEVAKAAARGMEASQAIGTAGPQVANRYEIHLNPGDFERFASFRLALTRDVEQYLEDQAKRLGLRPVDAWQVSIVADEAVRLGRIQVKSEMADIVASELPAHEAALGYTQPAPVLEPTPGATVGVLVVGEQQHVLSKRLTTLGRALDNDVVLSDSRVSRYHAHIQADVGRYQVSDLASTNGTFVSGRRVSEALLAPGDEISLGGLVVRFQVQS